MTKNRLLVLILLVLMVSVSSCGIFSKGCGCPTFGYVEHAPTSSLIAIATNSCHPEHSEGSSSPYIVALHFAEDASLRSA